MGDILHNKKAQAAMEFLMTYGWAIIVVLLVLAALFSLGIFSPRTSNTCIVNAPFTCTDVKLENDILTLYLGANGVFRMGPNIGFENVSANGIFASSGGGIISTTGINPLSFTVTGISAGGKFSGSGVIEYARETGAIHYETVQFSGIVEGGQGEVIEEGGNITMDIILPNITIVAPVNNQIFSNSVISVSGTASDNINISNVSIKVNNDPWTIASGTTSWSISVTLLFGNNTIYAQAFDTSNNPSAIQQVNVTSNETTSGQGIFYISSSMGDDINDGLSPTTPWKNIWKVYTETYGNRMNSSNTVLLKRGDIWEGQMIFAPGKAPKLIGTYGTGEKPIIYGDGRGYVWVPVSGHPGIYSAFRGAGGQIMSLYDNNNYKYSVAPGEPCCGPGSLDAFLNNMPLGSWGPPAAGFDTTWVRTLDGNPPVNFKVYRGMMVYLNLVNNTIIENLDLREIGAGYYGQYNDNITIRGLDINNSITISIYLSTGTTNSAVLNNKITNVGYTSIYVYAGVNNVIRNNTIRGVLPYIMGIDRTNAELAGIGIQETIGDIVEYNNISNTRDSGVDFFYNNNSIIRYNMIRNTSGGLYPLGSNITVFGNIIDQTGRNGNGMNGATTDLPIKILHNTFYMINGYALMSISNKGIIFRNNIVHGIGNSALTVFSSSQDSDYNCYYSNTSTPNFVYGVWPNETSYPNLSAFQIATGKDIHSVYANPELDSDFHLGTSSACVNNGTDVSSMIGFPYKDYYGTTIPQGSAPDIGAVEG